MRLCPYCHTEVIEDAPFCPECRRPLAITGQAVTITGQAVKGKSKKKLAVIIACVIASVVIVVLVTLPLKSVAEPPIPAHFTTYTDELGLFSISYPSEWQPDLEVIVESEQAVEDIIRSIDWDLSVSELSQLFIAGLPTITGLNPYFIIAVGPLPGTTRTHDEVVTAEVEEIKAVISSYHEFSRVKTTVGNRTATIVEWQGNFCGVGKVRYVEIYLLVSKTVWYVTCATLQDEYSNWECTFDAIVRSLRILK